MPAIIVVVALLILAWSLWSSRQNKIRVAETVEVMIQEVCAGRTPPTSIRWSNAIVRDAFLGSLDPLCAAAAEDRTVAVVAQEGGPDGTLEARIGLGGTIVMSLQIHALDNGTLVVQGWSSE